jgi:hypothetical protein
MLPGSEIGAPAGCKAGMEDPKSVVFAFATLASFEAALARLR